MWILVNSMPVVWWKERACLFVLEIVKDCYGFDILLLWIYVLTFYYCMDQSFDILLYGFSRLSWENRERVCVPFPSEHVLTHKITAIVYLFCEYNTPYVCVSLFALADNVLSVCVMDKCLQNLTQNYEDVLSPCIWSCFFYLIFFMENKISDGAKFLYCLI